MKIAVVGGGPAGLYFSILMRKADPRHEIELFERNAPDDTFGWGVVFSDATLDNLEEADKETHDAIAASFARWDAIDVVFRGRTIRSGGHGFCGIARKRLLNILQERAASLGVRLHHGSEARDLDRLASADLLVGADGVKSAVRARHAGVFRPDLDVRKAKYVWLGTTRPFDAFTFLVRENEHGLFQVHAYRFDETTSTFIAECDPESWRAAGLDGASTAATVAYLEHLFAEDLQGHRLLTNKSEWISFVTVKNERWRHGNVVLMGDAAHTAHFSIGSGTKMAMEDAICLRRAIGESRSLDAALADYEEERKWYVERLQDAAQDSLEFFEEIGRFKDYEPERLAYCLLTRSNKVTHDNLKERDPEYIASVERWFARPAPPRPPLLTPFRLRGLTLENRVVCSPMCMYSAEDGTVNDWHLVHLGSRAVGGAGLVMAEMTDVSREARITPGCAGMYKPEHVAAWKRVVDFVHERSGARIGLQIAHAGRKGSTKLMWLGIDEPLEEGNWPLLSASPLPYFGDRSQVPREMDRRDMDLVRDQFARAARMAEEAGFDLLEIHMAHGYLLACFLSPLTNVRADEYGGTLENRLRFPLEVFDAVRAAWPEQKPISVRMSGTEWVEGGLTVEDAVEIARALKAHGCDIVDVSSGLTTPESEPEYGRCFQTPFAHRIRNEAGIPTIAVGGISRHGEINRILVSGSADLCALARPHLSDPYFTLHAAAQLEHFDQRWPDQYEPAKPRRREKLRWLEREAKRNRG
ncbi:MAG: bifunctional salicylyl-CoA 5-hydroxylase/oxidoreductase [Planctomycetota bacterium]